MKTIENIQMGDKIRLTSVKHDLIFTGIAESREGRTLIVQRKGNEMLGYFLDVYDWDSVENLTQVKPQ